MEDKYLERLISKYQKRLEHKKETVTDYRESNDPELRNSVLVYENKITEIELILKGLYLLR
jgi:hypothetical protein